MGDYYAANNVGLNGGLMNLIFSTPANVPLTSYKILKIILLLCTIITSIDMESIRICIGYMRKNR